MKTLHDMPVWAPTDEELRELENRVRAERAGAATSAVTYVTRKVGSFLTAERAADKVHLDASQTS
ncbi:MAG: hypothetical protein ACR2PA_18840 [Hyphomicrobiaceae bacterium]